MAGSFILERIVKSTHALPDTLFKETDFSHTETSGRTAFT